MVTHGQSPIQLKPHNPDDPGYLQAGGQGFESP